MDQPRVSIVMLCWNRISDVRESLTGIAKSTYKNLEVIVVDNGSTDGTQDMIKENFPTVKLMEMSDNLGIEAYNHGFKAAEGDYIVILDDDSFPAPDAITKMVDKFLEDEKLGICAFDVRNFSSYDEVSFDDHNITGSAESKEYYMGFNGAGAGVRKSVWKDAGYYPGEFFLYMNEADSAIRVWNLGYKVVFFPDIVSYHKLAATNRNSWRAPFYYTRNSFWLIWKNYPLTMAVKQTVDLIYKCIYSSFEQHTTIYLKALASAFISANKIKREPVNSEIAKKMRIPFNLSFTFFR